MLANGVRVLALLLLSSGTAAAVESAIQVAVFQGEGVGKSAERLIASLSDVAGEDYRVSRITVAQVRASKLAGIDVLVHPGGSGSKQGKALGEAGRNAVRDFVEHGGGYLGVCAGAYLATNEYPWSLHLIDAKVVDRRHWARGKGPVTLQLSPRAREFFRHSDQEMTIHYGQGPLLARREWDDVKVPDYESLAIYASEIAEKDAPRGIMVGTSAAVRCKFGRGRVLCFSPHPELTEGLGYMIPTAVDWLAADDDK
ncbi:MAG: BPL-N domain-containing protein [Planctomycetota bacterium]